MATYNITHTLQNSTSYPAAVFSSTFAPDTSVYFKLGDTIQATVNHPISGNTLGISLNDVNEANPDPSNLGGTFTHADGYTYSLTWSGTFAEGGSASSDFFTQWFHFNRTGTFQYSAKSVFRRVSANIALNTSTVASSGGTLTLTASNIQGLLAPSGNNAHRLYLYVRNSSGTLITSDVSFSTAGNNAYLGKITTTTTSSTITIGSSLPAGTYTVHIGHYGGGGSGNVFYGTDHSITTATFTKSSAPATDTTPDAFSIGNNQTISASGQYDATQFTVSGINAAATVSVSGSGTPSVSIAGGTHTSSSTTVTNGQTVNFRMFAPGTPGTSHSATLNIGGVTASITLTAASGGGSSIGGASGTSNYGLQVLGPPDGSGNQATIFSPNFKISNLVAFGSESNIQNGSPRTVPSSGVFEGLSSSNDKVKVIFLLDSHPLTAYSVTVTKNTGAGEGTVTFTNTGSGTISGIKYYVLRTE